MIGCNHIVRQNAAVAPAADAHMLRVSDTDFYYVVNPGFEVGDFMIAPVAGDRPREFPPAPRAAPVVYVQHGIAVRSEHLTLHSEVILVLPIGAAVDAQDERNTRAFHIAHRIREEPVNIGAVFTFETYQ